MVADVVRQPHVAELDHPDAAVLVPDGEGASPASAGLHHLSEKRDRRNLVLRVQEERRCVLPERLTPSASSSTAATSSRSIKPLGPWRRPACCRPAGARPSKCGTASVGVARQYCGALGKRANCQVAVSVHAATDTASCPLEWELFLPGEWIHDDGRRRRAGIPDEVGHVSKTHLALGLLDRLAAQGLTVPVIVADAGYGRSVSFRLALEERGWSYVMAVDPKEIARPADAEPYQPAYGGLGPPTLPRYRQAPRSLPGLVAEAAVFEEVTWRQGSKGMMSSHFAVLQVRPSGKEASRTAHEQLADATGGTVCCRCGRCWSNSPNKPTSRPATG